MSPRCPNGARSTAAPRDAIVVPAGVPFGLSNAGREPVRIHVVTVRHEGELPPVRPTW
jgi:mannose-6-phosphate isomerase-like protein (cupin superfamily)